MRAKVLIAAVVLMSTLCWLAAVVAIRASWRATGELAHAATLAEIGAHPQSTIVYDRSNRPAFTFYVEQRMDVPLDRVSPHMIDALLAVEDRRFYSHHGLDPSRIVKAAWRNWKRGRIVEGATSSVLHSGACECPVRKWKRFTTSRVTSGLQVSSPKSAYRRAVFT